MRFEQFASNMVTHLPGMYCQDFQLGMPIETQKASIGNFSIRNIQSFCHPLELDETIIRDLRSGHIEFPQRFLPVI